jgi:hypothetical protein
VIGANSTAPVHFHRSRLPVGNAWVESFDGRLRDELLNSWRFDSLLEAAWKSKTGAATTTRTGPTPPTANLPRTEFALPMDHAPPTPRRIATGPPNGSPSEAAVLGQPHRLDTASCSAAPFFATSSVSSHGTFLAEHRSVGQAGNTVGFTVLHDENLYQRVPLDLCECVALLIALRRRGGFSPPAATLVPADGALALTAEASDWLGADEPSSATRTTVRAARRWTVS